MMPKRWQHLQGKIAMLLAALLLGLGMAEVIVRTFYTKYRRPHHELFLEYHPLLGWQNIPNKTGLHRSDEFEIRETFNSKGIRGPEYSYHKKNDEFRILILGDSFAEGYTVDFEDLFSEVLKRRLNVDFGQYVEVINAGTAGYSTDQELLFFQHEGRKYKPDLTILLFFLNDVWFNNQPQYYRYYKPLFEIRDNEPYLTRIPSLSADPYSIQTSRENSTRLRYVQKWLYDHTVLYEFVQNRIMNTYRLKVLANTLGLINLPPTKVSPSLPPQWKVFEKDYDEDVQKAWEITEALLVKLTREVASNGSQFLLFYVPSHVRVDPRLAAPIARKYGLSEEQLDIHKIARTLARISDRHDIDFIDPTRQFKAWTEPLYFSRDRHWNIEGHQAAGEILAEYIQSKY